MEIQEVMRAYQVYLPEVKLEYKRVGKMLEMHEIFDNTFFPEEFEKLYNEIN